MWAKLFLDLLLSHVFNVGAANNLSGKNRTAQTILVPFRFIGVSLAFKYV